MIDVKHVKIVYVLRNNTSRAKTNLDMVKNLNSDFFHVYKTKKGRVSMKVDENES